jgi:hypothetical protein
MACQSGPFGNVNNARSAEFANGNAKKAWDKLISTYESGNMANIIALFHQWTKCTLGKNENPDSWYMELDRIWERLGNTSSAVSDGAYVAHMNNNLPESNKSLVVGRFGLARNTLTVEEIMTDIQDYCNLYVWDDVETTNKYKSEQALYTKGKF